MPLLQRRRLPEASVGLGAEPEALADVADDREHEGSPGAGVADRVERELDGDLLARLAPGRHLDHGPGVDDRAVAGRVIAGQAGPVPLLEALGNEHLDRQATRLGRRVAEHRFGGRIPQHDPPVGGLGDHNRVAHVREQPPDPQVAGGEHGRAPRLSRHASSPRSAPVYRTRVPRMRGAPSRPARDAPRPLPRGYLALETLAGGDLIAFLAATTSDGADTRGSAPVIAEARPLVRPGARRSA